MGSSVEYELGRLWNPMMTSPPTQPRTGNEQRIASLEAEIVTLREALETIADRVAGEPLTFQKGVVKLARSALSSSSDYANKVVVSKVQLNQMVDVVTELWETLRPGEPFPVELPRLDSLRQGGSHES